MDYKLRKKVHSLRKVIFKYYIDLINENKRNEFEIIESMLGILLNINILFPNVSDILHEIDETSYYEFEKLFEEKDDIYKLTFNLKKEIIEKFGYSEEFLNSHKNQNYKNQYNKDIDLIKILHFNIRNLLLDCDILKYILSKYKDLRFENIEPLLKKLNNIYIEYEEIYANYLEPDIEDEYDDDSEDEYDDELEEDLEEDFDDKWKGICTFNYDLSFIDDIYCYIFDEINDEQRILIGIMISDFYEYHKCNEEMYTRPDNDDILDTLDFIEETEPDEIIKYFLGQPTWQDFILDTYIYYNTNFTDRQKLSNRIHIKNIGKLHILKNNNKFIDDTLKDESLNNKFIISYGELIRLLNESIFYSIDSIDNSQTDELLLKYFTSDFFPYVAINHIPKELKEMSIKDLKKLQLRFIISDFFARKLSENNHNIEMLLKFGKPDGIYNTIISDRKTLKHILEDFSKNLDNNEKIELNEKQQQKIIKFNALAAFDNL